MAREENGASVDAARSGEHLPVVDLADPTLWQDPAAALAPIREAAALARTTRGERVVLRYADTERWLADPRMRTIGSRLLEGVGIVDGPISEWWRLVMFNTNPPEHGRLRNEVSRAFTPRQVDRLRPRVRSMATELIRPLLGAGVIDYEAAVADPLPIRVTCALLGVPDLDHDAVADWTSQLGRIFATRLSETQRARSEAAYQSLSSYLSELLEIRRRKPEEDVLSGLVAAGGSGTRGERLSARECQAMAINLLFAGHDTTRALLSIGLGALLRASGSMADLRTDARWIEGAVEEMLRFEPPVLGSLRAPAEDIEVEGGLLPANGPVHFLFPGGNRDPRIFDEPNRFDIRRAGARPLAFGLGAHFCLGAGLARMEAQETLKVLLDLTRSVQLVEDPVLAPFATIRRLTGGLQLNLTAR